MFIGYQIKKVINRKNFTILFFLVILLFFSIKPISAMSNDEFIHLDEIYPGMEGIGKTVFSGTEIEDFNVLVIDVIAGNQIDDSYILVKLSGDRIDQNGGISAGMSGSPVYLGGRLAGAVSHAWEMSEHNLCLVTPIVRMLDLFKYTENHQIQSQKVGQLLPLVPDRVNINNISAQGKRMIDLFSMHLSFSEDPRFSLWFEPIQTPLFIFGIHGRAGEYLKTLLIQKGFTNIQNSSQIGNPAVEQEIMVGNQKLEPGSAIGIQLSSGDTSVISIGTTTYSQNQTVLALGHPFMHSGNASYLLSTVYIYHSFPNIIMPFKIGIPDKLIGEVIQDRDSGILARLNQFPRVVSCRVNVVDLDHHIDLKTGIKIVPQNDILQSVILSFIIQSVDRIIDRIGQGTANIKVKIIEDKPNSIMQYDNMIFHQNDIAFQCSQDIEAIFDIIINNYCTKIEFSEIQIDIEITEENKSAIIKEVNLKNEGPFTGGETLEAEVVIKPFRKPEEIKIAKLIIPEETEEGDAIFIVRGGSSVSIDSEEDLLVEEDRSYLLENLGEIEAYFNQDIKNNQIVIELIAINQLETVFTSEKSIKKENSNDPSKVILKTDYIIEGYDEKYIKIIPKTLRSEMDS